MNLQARYAAALGQKSFSADPAQERAVATLERVRRELIGRGPGAHAVAALLRRVRGRNPAPVRGAYLWGGVGRGKTFLMDLFFESLPFQDRLRFHFHRLMYRVHGRLRVLHQQENPLEVVADEFAAQARVICFDEFFVSDIADAMILGNLLDALFRRGVTLVATSNSPPEDLYRDGLQRARFLPAIAFIKQHTETVRVDAGIDYRLRVLERAGIWHLADDDEADARLERWFDELAPDEGSSGEAIEINGRNIRTRRRANGIAWFEFASLCAGPRSQDDYIEIARAFQAIVLADVPVFDETGEDEARRFIALVDEFYERKVKLIVSAAAPPERLYRGSRLAHEFQRTSSRLREMQSVEYLAAAHVP